MDSQIQIAVIGVIGTLLGGLIVYFSNRLLNKANVNLINADTIIKLSKRIDELESRDASKEERIDWLEKELKRYVNAYTLAIRFIHDRMPLIEIPNFLETDPRIKGK